MSNIYCTKCKRKTKSSSVEHIKTPGKTFRLKATCDLCGCKKSQFTKVPNQEVKTQYDHKYIEAIELHRPVVKKFPRRRIVTLCIDDLWAADLMIMRKYASENDGFKYILNVIDTFSKYAWSEPLTNKSATNVTRAFKNIVERAISVGHHRPNLLHVDRGTEFVNKEFKRLLQSLDNIKMYHTENEEKSSIIERFNRTCVQKFKLQFEINQSFRWIDILPDILYEYNNTVHRTIRMAPACVTVDDEPRLRKLFCTQDKCKRFYPKLKIGDRVRITTKKDVFANKYSHNWNREIFTVSKILDTLPVTYRIVGADKEEIIGSFYEKELNKSLL